MNDNDNGIAQLRVPPHSIESEMSVLGGLLLDWQSWDKVGDILSSDDFYRFEHRLIFDAIYWLANASQPCDTITVFERLRSVGNDEEAGGLVYLNSLAQYVPSASNIRRYAEIVREHSILRQLVTISDDIATSALNPKGRSVTDLLDDAENAVMAVGDRSASGGMVHIHSAVAQMIERVQVLADNPGAVTGTPTGFHDIDRMTAGMQAGDLIVVAARPSIGKTALAMNVAEHVSLQQGLPSLVFSMEMGAGQLATRLVGSVGRIDQMHLRTGRLTDDEWGRFTGAVEKVGSMPLVIDESPGLTISELRARARREARKQGKLGLIVVDYLQLMSGLDGSDENRATELGVISRGLKMLAKELQCPVIALSQLNRSVEQRTDKRPVMSDIRESGAIEQDADVILLMYRDDYYNINSTEPGVAEVNIAKQRSGPTGVVKLAFIKPITRFESLAH